MNSYHEQLQKEHNERMLKRNSEVFQQQPIENFLEVDSENVKFTLAVAVKLLETFNASGVECDFYGYQFSQYFNDSFTKHNRPWFEDVDHEYLKISMCTTLGQIDFYIDEQDQVVIDRIISNQKGNGSKMVNLILDVADENELVIVTVPTCTEYVRSLQISIERTQGLRNWISEFGFKDIKNSAKMIYSSNC